MRPSVLCLRKRVLQCVDHAFRDDEADADRLAGHTVPPLTLVSSDTGRLSPIMDCASVCAQLRQIGTDRDRFAVAGGLQVLLHGGDRHHALVGILQVPARLFRLDAFSPSARECWR